jgi:hypothetical protein
MDCHNPDCGENSIVSKFTASGIVRYCVRCNAPLATQPVKLNIDEQPDESRPVSRQPVAAQVKSQPRKAITPASIVRDARARIAELNREIKHLKSLTKERDELKRLLAAAKRKPLDCGAVVRPLRKQG